MKLKFGDKLEFGLWNSSSIKPEAEKPDTKKNRERRRSADLKKNKRRGRRSRALKKNRGRRSGWRRKNPRWRRRRRRRRGTRVLKTRLPRGFFFYFTFEMLICRIVL